ncbi:hypothetical protein VD0002_g1420 [Verticillium dahliae]|uniref:Uncharacterized protein n=1 Tax=Verticillium dahliae TaxID=27337 RepID=A0AA44WIG7_VERDA|nr:hypothetical protein BJF96_g6550 [Verticillium dahliae]PNH47121.1 hypothetical protein VD0004_g1109 [Verticillium dahliae]PNH55536.1 hypothetical protein VD0003_g2112 [Verticillium dahliae]PNH68650.1 hypothetical protein VD0002_g1420 [Verticillium dahliae]PNH76798.1 hypothetical protein VD0001_g829 [Verticillium dahliae]
MQHLRLSTFQMIELRHLKLVVDREPRRVDQALLLNEFAFTPEFAICVDQ